MNSKTLTILLVAAGATAAAAAVALRSGGGSHAEEPAAKDKLLPGFAGVRNDVATIRVQRAGGGYTLRRTNDTWTIEDKGGYPVQFDQVKRTVNALADATLVEAKTGDPARYAKLGVEDFDAPDSKSTLVTLTTKDGKEIAKLVVGKESESSGAAASGQRYVRKAGEKQSWLANLKLELHEKPTDWLAKEILKVTQDRVRSIEIRQPDGETLLVDRPAADVKDFTLHGIAEGKEATYPTVANSLATGLEYVNLEDVVPAADVDFTTGAGPIARFTTFDGLVVTVTTKDQDGKSYASFTASYEAPPETPAVEPPKEGEAPKPPAPPVKPADEVKKEAETLNARLSKWTYVISSYSRAQFGKKLAELVKDKAPPAPPADPNAPPDDGMGGENDPVLIPSDLPPEIRDQIKAHQESIGNKTADGPPRKKLEEPPAGGGETPPPAPPVEPEPQPDPKPDPQADSKPPQR